MRLVIKTHNRRELMLSMVALVESTGQYKDPLPAQNNCADGIVLRSGTRDIEAYTGRTYVGETIFVDALKDSIDDIWNAIRRFMKNSPVVMDFSIMDGQQPRKVIVDPGKEIIVGCARVTKGQVDKIFKVWNKK